MLSFLSVLCLAAQPFLEGLLCNTFPEVGVKENFFMSALVYFPGREARCSLPQPVPAEGCTEGSQTRNVRAAVPWPWV